MITEKVRTTLDQVLDEKCQKTKIPGMALIASHHGKRVYEKYYGYRNVEEKLPVTSETVFGVASITKSFASLAIMQLVDKGKLSAHDQVKKWVPQFELPGGG